MPTFNSKLKQSLIKIFTFVKANLFLILLLGIVIYQNGRMNELEKDLGKGFAFESTTDIVDRLADDVKNLKYRADDAESATEDISSTTSDLEGRISDLESQADDLVSDIRRLKYNY